MLQELLNLGLVDIGSDDSRFAKMQAASEALVEILKNDPSGLVPTTLIALDNTAAEDEPTFSMVEKLVIDEWNTLRNTHVNRPRELLRAITITALAVVAEGSPEVAGAVWHTAISPFNHRQARLGKEADLVTELLYRLGEAAEREAVARAGMVELAAKKRLPTETEEKGGLKLQAYSKLKDDELISDVARAAGPQDPQGAALTNANPNWTNAGQQWSHDFYPRMTSALVKGVNLGLSRLSESLTKSIEQRLTDHVTDVWAMVSDAQGTNSMRLDVLWWCEAKYSPSLNCGYRELPPAVAALATAHDLAQLVPALAPASVTYVLGEAMASLSLPKDQAELRTLADLLSVLAVEGSAVKKLFPEWPSNQGRVPLVDLVTEAVGGNKARPKDLRARAGLNPSLELTIQEFAMWVFRDLQARKLVEGLR